MTDNTVHPVEANPTEPSAPQASAGAILRGLREDMGLGLETLASTLRVPVAKLQALEEDRIDLLPDAVFARALAQAVCRHLKTDAAPVLALLPGQDVSRLAVKDERGLDHPLHRPSLLPQSSFLVIQSFFTPMRVAAVLVLALAIFLAVWPDVQPEAPAPQAVPAAVVETPPAEPAPSPAAEPVTAPEPNTGRMVITPVQSAIVPAPASAASGVTHAP